LASGAEALSLAGLAAGLKPRPSGRACYEMAAGESGESSRARNRPAERGGRGIMHRNELANNHNSECHFSPAAISMQPNPDPGRMPAPPHAQFPTE